jgi:WD40 repeat protein
MSKQVRLQHVINSLGYQSLFLGHTNKISIIATDARTLLLATAQTGKNPIVRIWDVESCKCHAVLQVHQNEISCLALSDSGNSMVGVGKDRHMKELIVIWDISKIAQTGQAPIVIQHSFDYSVTSMKFLPFEETKLVSCGSGNIRFWRLKGGIFRGCGLCSENFSLTKQEFLDCAFEKGFNVRILENLLRFRKITNCTLALEQVLYIKYHLHQD